MNNTKPKVTIYSDGGCRPNPGTGGWGAVLIFDTYEEDLSGGEKNSTNNRMELTAVISALVSLDDAHQVDLYTDSEYVKNGITKWIKGWIQKDWKDVKNPDLWQQLDQVTQEHTIKWHWVKGHAGHAYNERVDELATREIERLTGKTFERKPEPAEIKVDADTRIYISANYSFEDKRGGWGALIVGQDNEQELSGKEVNSSENQLLLIAAARALESMKMPGSVAVYTASEYIQKGMSQWVKGWIKKGWRTAGGDPVKNRELWERLVKAAEIHPVQWLMQGKAQSGETTRTLQLAKKANQ
ncbi:MAG: ribonuclease HI [Chloroflexota bacterium]